MWIKVFKRESVTEVAGKCLSTSIKDSVLPSSSSAREMSVVRKKI